MSGFTRQLLIVMREKHLPVYSREHIANKCFPITPRMVRHEVDKEVLLWGNILTAVAYLVIAVQLVIFVRNRKVSNEQ